MNSLWKQKEQFYFKSKIIMTVSFLIFKQTILHLAKRYAAASVVSLETNGFGEKKKLFYTSKPSFFVY